MLPEPSWAELCWTGLLLLFTVSLNESASAAAAAAARVQQMSCLQTALSRFVSKLSLVSIKLYNTLPDFHARSVVFCCPLNLVHNASAAGPALQWGTGLGVCLYMPRGAALFVVGLGFGPRICACCTCTSACALGQAIVLPFGRKILAEGCENWHSGGQLGLVSALRPRK